MSRDVVLGNVRAALAKGGTGIRQLSEDIGRRLEASSRRMAPLTAAGRKEELLQRFIGRLEEQSVSVMRSVTADVPGAVVSYLDSHRLPLRVRMGADERLAAMAWDAVPQIVRSSGRAGAADVIGLSHAEAGIAEAGALLILSGAGNPTSLAFLPETHIVVLRENDVTGTFEEAFDIVRGRTEGRRLPRAVNLITGPSRTGDIGGRIVVGAHGPRRLGVVTYRESAGT